MPPWTLALLSLTALLLQRPDRTLLPAQATAPIVYSSIRYIEDAGDAVGTEVILLRRCDRLFVSYQEAEGGILSPHLVTATEHADTIAFVIPPDSGSGAGSAAQSDVTPPRAVSAVVSGRALVLRVGDVVDTLPRRRRPYVGETLAGLRHRAATSCGANTDESRTPQPTDHR